jgi:hypothetical protein
MKVPECAYHPDPGIIAVVSEGEQGPPPTNDDQRRGAPVALGF